jgi:hypothetical protein
MPVLFYNIPPIMIIAVACFLPGRAKDLLFDGKNIFRLMPVLLYINSTNIPLIMIINRIYENQNLLSL